MTTREVLASVVLALAAELTLLAVFVFLGEPHDTGRTATRFEAVDIAYLAVPLALVAAAVAIPLRAFLRDDAP